MRGEIPPRDPLQPLGWRSVLLIMLACHGTSTLMLRVVPTIAPEIVTQYGWSQSFVGWLATLANLGSIVLVAAGVGLLRVLGSVRSLRVGLAAGAVGVLLLMVPYAPLALLAGFVIGLGHGPANPAGNEILQRVVPAARQGFIFSVKQSSVPVAGMLGGLILPGVAQAWGVAGAMVVVAAVAILTLFATAPIRRRDRSTVAPGTLWQIFSRENMVAPLSAVAGFGDLRSLAVSGFLLAFVQSIWFVYLTSFLVFGLGYAATAAGLLYALMQATSIVGRLLLGWVGDRLGTSMPLILGSLVLSCAATLALAALVLTGELWVTLAVCVLGGFAAAGWNGVQVAETVRLAPEGRMYEAVSGVTLAIGFGVVSGPLAVAMLLDFGMGWGAILGFLALVPLLGIGATIPLTRREWQQRREGRA